MRFASLNLRSAVVGFLSRKPWHFTIKRSLTLTPHSTRTRCPHRHSRTELQHWFYSQISPIFSCSVFQQNSNLLSIRYHTPESPNSTFHSSYFQYRCLCFCSQFSCHLPGTNSWLFQSHVVEIPTPLLQSLLLRCLLSPQQYWLFHFRLTIFKLWSFVCCRSQQSLYYLKRFQCLQPLVASASSLNLGPGARNGTIRCDQQFNSTNWLISIYIQLIWQLYSYS